MIEKLKPLTVMARSRKNIEVLSVLNYANNQLGRTDEYADMKFKAGICIMIENILMKSNNYKGFVFQNNEDSEIGTEGFYNRIYLQ
jgi:hypothetical protein